MIEYYQKLIDENRALHGSDIMIPNGDLEILLKIARAAQDFMDAKMNANDAAVDQAQQNLYEALSALPPVEDKEPGE